MRPEDLHGELRAEADLIAETLAGVEAFVAEGRDPSMLERQGLALSLADLYTGVETVMKRICRALDVPLPQGERWHADLFDMYRNPRRSGLPELLDPPLLDEIDNYRKFRHVAIHAYGVRFQWERMRPGVLQARAVFGAFLSRLEAYIASLPQYDASS